METGTANCVGSNSVHQQRAFVLLRMKDSVITHIQTEAGPGCSAEDATRQRDSLGIKVIFKNGATAADKPSMRVPTSKKIEHPRVEVEEFAPLLNEADEKFFSF
jgi:hypothetical protein